jgi:hypothetical protein
MNPKPEPCQWKGCTQPCHDTLWLPGERTNGSDKYASLCEEHLLRAEAAGWLPLEIPNDALPN